MFIITLLSLIIPLTTAVYRDPSKTLKTLPAFTNSLVNLGKMDMSFYFMAKPEDFKKSENIDHAGSSPLKNNHLIAEPCPCSSKYSRNFPKNNPSELLKMTLRNNDLFKQEPETSIMCCESHENSGIQEETIFLEFSPNHIQAKGPLQHNQLPFLPFIFENLGLNKPMLPAKPKAVELFFFPNKKDMNSEFGKAPRKEFKKEAIQIVGDKELRNDFKTMKLKPPQTLQSSVKKDLALQGMEKTLTTKVNEIKQDSTPALANML